MKPATSYYNSMSRQNRIITIAVSGLVVLVIALIAINLYAQHAASRYELSVNAFATEVSETDTDEIQEVINDRPVLGGAFLGVINSSYRQATAKRNAIDTHVAHITATAENEGDKAVTSALADIVFDVFGTSLDLDAEYFSRLTKAQRDDDPERFRDLTKELNTKEVASLKDARKRVDAIEPTPYYEELVTHYGRKIDLSTALREEYVRVLSEYDALDESNSPYKEFNDRITVAGSNMNATTTIANYLESFRDEAKRIAIGRLQSAAETKNFTVSAGDAELFATVDVYKSWIVESVPAVSDDEYEEKVESVNYWLDAIGRVWRVAGVSPDNVGRSGTSLNDAKAIAGLLFDGTTGDKSEDVDLRSSYDQLLNILYKSIPPESDPGNQIASVEAAKALEIDKRERIEAVNIPAHIKPERDKILEHQSRLIKLYDDLIADATNENRPLGDAFAGLGIVNDIADKQDEIEDEMTKIARKLDDEQKLRDEVITTVESL